MALQTINRGTTANDGTGDDARTWADKSNANFTYLENLIGSIASEVENAPYANMAALYADQANQNVGKIQYVLDASAHPDVSTAEARHFEYLGTTVGDYTDYRLLSYSESTALTNPAAYRTFLIEALQDDGTPLTTVSTTKISFEYNGVNVTGILFNANFSIALANFYNTNCDIQFYNITKGLIQKASVLNTAWTTVNTDYYRIEITPGDILLADLSVNDRVEFAISQAISALEGTSVLSTGEAGGSKFLREDGDGTCSWQAIPGGGDLLAANNLSDVASAATSRTNLGIDTTANQTDSTDKRFVTDAEKTVIGNTSGTNTGDQDLSGLQPKPAEGQFVDGDKTKLDGIETGATADQSDAEIETAYNNQVSQVSGGEITAGTETAVRRFSPADIKAFVEAHETKIDSISFFATDADTDLEVAETKGIFAPYAFTLLSYWVGCVDQVPTGAGVEVDLLKNGVSCTSTAAEIDSGEETSLTGTSPVLTITSFAEGDFINGDILGIGSTDAGQLLQIVLKIQKT